MTGNQRQLTEFIESAGGSEPFPLYEPEGYDYEWSKRVRQYAESKASGGWEIALVKSDAVWFEHPDPTTAKTYHIERKSAGWRGYRRDRQVQPGYTDDLQEALDTAEEWMREHPVEGHNSSDNSTEDDNHDQNTEPMNDSDNNSDDTPRILTVVSCANSKQDLDDGETLPARELYNSAIHTCKDRYGRHSDAYYIASAKFGLVHHDEELPEYDQRLSEKSHEEQKQWGDEVVEVLQDAIERHEADAVVFIGGKEYVGPILHAVDVRGVETPIYTPWQSLDSVTGSGKGMSWCNEEAHWPENLTTLDPAVLGESRNGVGEN